MARRAAPQRAREILGWLRSGAAPRVQEVLHRVGYEVVAYPPDDPSEARLARLLGAAGVSVVLDVGANDGHYASRLRRLGYTGRIVSFEPLAEPHARLLARAAGDLQWEVHRLALSDAGGTALMNVAANSVSSSLLPMEGLHERSAPESGYVATEEVPTTTLDALAGELVPPGATTYLKIDVQGSELRVLRGARELLDRVDFVELELSLAPLYQGGPLLPELVSSMDEQGFRLIDMVPGLSDPQTGALLQIDGVFARVTSRTGP